MSNQICFFFFWYFSFSISIRSDYKSVTETFRNFKTQKIKVVQNLQSTINENWEKK